MIRRNLIHLLVLSLVLNCAIADEDKAKVVESDKTDEKSVSKRGILHHYSTHGHVHPAVVSSTHYHLPAAAPALPSVLKYPVLHKPAFLPAPILPALAPVPSPQYHITPGGASVTSYSVNYPRLPVLPRPALPIYPRPIVPSVFAAASPDLVPAYYHHHHQPAFHNHHIPHVHAPAVPHYHTHSVPHSHSVPHYHTHSVPHSHSVPHYHTPHLHTPHYHHAARPLIPVAVPYPSVHRHPKYPVYFNYPRPVFTGVPQFVPAAASPAPTPAFIPIPVPANPQPANSGTNFNPATNEFPQIPAPTHPTFFPQNPTQPTFVQIPQQPMFVNPMPPFHRPMHTRPTFVNPTQPTFVEQPSMHAHGWRPMVMTKHRPQATQPTFTNKQPPYNYHAPAVPFNHDQASSTNDIISGQGQMSAQLAQQLALYQQHQQYLQHHQENSFPYPAAAETFHQNYDAPSNDGHYQGLSSYQVPIHH